MTKHWHLGLHTVAIYTGYGCRMSATDTIPWALLLDNIRFRYSSALCRIGWCVTVANGRIWHYGSWLALEDLLIIIDEFWLMCCHLSVYSLSLPFGIRLLLVLMQSMLPCILFYFTSTASVVHVVRIKLIRWMVCLFFLFLTAASAIHATFVVRRICKKLMVCFL